MKTNNKLNFRLALACLIGICVGCRGVTLPPRPEDQVVRLDQREPSPAAKKDGNFKSGDPVVIVDNDGRLFFDTVKGIWGEIALVRSESGSQKNWMLSKNGRPVSVISFDEQVERISPKGYAFEYGSRRKEYKYFPPEQIFSVPWASNVNLKAGDTVYSLENKYRYLEKGIVTEAPTALGNAFYVRFGDHADATLVGLREVCSAIEPAQPEDLSPGTFVFYSRGWAMVIGKRDDKIIIREVNWSSDAVVDVSKLQIVR